MSIESLRGLVSPPDQPVEVPDDATWMLVERELGVALPRDFKDCLRIYGTGSFGGFLWVFNPASANPHLHLKTQIQRSLDGLRTLKAEDPEELPYALFPEPEGLLPWGITDNGDGLYWHTAGEPEQWTVVVNAGRDPECEEFPLGATGFLAAILRQSIKSDVLPSDFPPRSPRFQPVDH